MAVETVRPITKTPTPVRLGRIVAVGVAILLVLALAIAAQFYQSWPFDRDKVLNVLKQASGRDVTIQKFRQTIFPPGCVLDGVDFEHHIRKDMPPLITVTRITVRASYLGMIGLRKDVPEVKVENLHITIPRMPNGQRAKVFPLNAIKTSNKIMIRRIETDQVRIDLPPVGNGPGGTILEIQKLVLHNVTAGDPFDFAGLVHISNLPGDLHAKGTFGPWNPQNPGATPVKGSYRFAGGKLAAIKLVTGTVQSEGQFSGPMGRVSVSGTASVPDFRVTRSTHIVPTSGKFRAQVNAVNGDVSLESSTISLNKTTVTAAGAVAGKPGEPGKTANLHFIVRDGRVQDLLLLFIQSKVAPLTGTINLTADATVPPGPRPFLEKLEMKGSFDILGGDLTNPKRQQPLNELSDSAKGESKEQADSNPRPALSNIRGEAVVRDGVANLSGLSFEVPGARAVGSGTFNLINEAVNLQGTLYTTGKISETTSGFKAVMVKFVSLFLHKHGEEVVPFKITGTYSDPKLGLDLGRKH